ncbi:Myb-like_DNA-binding domain-containing protein [Hexamita inflata]|uniref:Myb-like_DNA-binding domain-containing protein n=1 Tax=Hexamita inflata TaxID=28002 RepID=A0ABP1GVM3_9EUKA
MNSQIKSNGVYHSWTQEEEDKLKEMIGIYGRKWSYIQRSYFKHLTSDSIKNKYRQLEARLNEQPEKQQRIKEIKQQQAQNSKIKHEKTLNLINQQLIPFIPTKENTSPNQITLQSSISLVESALKQYILPFVPVPTEKIQTDISNYFEVKQTRQWNLEPQKTEQNSMQMNNNSQIKIQEDIQSEQERIIYQLGRLL